MTETPVTIEALQAAAHFAGIRQCEVNAIAVEIAVANKGVFTKDGNVAFHRTLESLARLIMECKPELIAESYEGQ